MRRAAFNSSAIAVGEIVGKLASLALVAVLARRGGASAVGLWIFAQSLCQITTMPVDFGLDRWLLRRIAADRAEYLARFPVVLGIKAALVVPCAALTWLLLVALGTGHTERIVVLVVFGGFLLDAISRLVDHVFSAVDRGALIAPGTIVQRVLAAGLGIAALETGHDLVWVAGAYVIGSAASAAVFAFLLHRHVGSPGWRVRLGGWREVVRGSVPFAAQDVLTVLLFRVDIVILSALATTAVVGDYGGAYRLLEATMFIASSLTGGFVAMFTYLRRDSEPTVQGVFAGAIRLAVAVLTPIALVFALLAPDVIRIFYGSDLGGAVTPLRLLAPVVVLLGVVALTSSLIVSREDPRAITKLTAIVTALNVALNLALIPPLGADGAALAMLVTEVVFLAAALRLAHRLVGPVPWARSLAGVLAGAAAMAIALVALHDRWLLAGAVGTVAYGVVLLLVERLTRAGPAAAAAGP